MQKKGHAAYITTLVLDHRAATPILLATTKSVQLAGVIREWQSSTQSCLPSHHIINALQYISDTYSQVLHPMY
jgi:hypothetical protein